MNASDWTDAQNSNAEGAGAAHSLSAPEEADRLIAALPAHLAAMERFSLATGLRAANVTGLQWIAVDLVRRVAWIHPDQAKDGGQYRFLSTEKRCCWYVAGWERSDARVQLSREADQAGQHQGLVFRSSGCRH